MRLRVTVDGEAHEVALERGAVVVDGQRFPAEVQGQGPDFEVRLGQRAHAVRVEPDEVRVDGEPFAVHVEALAPADAKVAHHGAAGPVRPPLPGRVVAVKVKEGQQVKAGQCLVVLEAMKMQNEVPAPADGVVMKVLAREGQLVDAKDVLVELGATGDPM